MKKIYIVALLSGIIIGASIGAINDIRKLIETRKETKRKEVELEKFKRELKRMNAAMEFERTKEQYEKTKGLCDLADTISESKTEEELADALEEALKNKIITKPWKGDFNEFMSNPNNTLDFGEL